MNITEIIEKIKQNLLQQEKMKEELEDVDARIAITDEKISYKSDNLVNAETDFSKLENLLKNELADNANQFAHNLKTYSMSYGDVEKECNLRLFFMDKQFMLLNEEEIVVLPKGSRVSVSDLVPFVFDKYIKKGDAIFDERNLAKLKEIVDLYNKNSDIVRNKLENKVVTKKTNMLQKDLERVSGIYHANLEELINVETALQKCKEFKSPLLQKVFTKKQKLKEQRDALAYTCETNKESVEKAKKVLEDKNTIKEEAKSVVEIELGSLLGVMTLLDLFKDAKQELINFKKKNIETIKAEIEDLQDFILNAQMTYAEIKGKYQLSKKINTEIVLNALQSKKFVDAFADLDLKKVSQEDLPAVKYITAKYNEHIRSQVDKFTK